ncbi:metal transporter [Flavobacterium album]|uniref:Metal transporter n=1 Tax=Flavobacterium album TaxID=2175091 RepID=A0A2S1QXF1_9FLAO|nr:cation transporter [Flavobacterium album]AWH85064.1 metal transporter [Flavobacterium album]
MKRLILILLITLTGLSVQAQEKKDKNAKYEIEVKGNCDQCKKRIEKAAYSVKGVKSAVWHEDQQDLDLIIDETKCSLNDVRAAIAKAGHDTDTIKAEKADYDNLHSCCKYDRG